jgi:Asp/Glu/hydantoin racemase
VRVAHGPGASRPAVAGRLHDVDRPSQRPLRIALIGPTCRSQPEVESEVAEDLERLARPDVELEYHVTGSGPEAVRSHEDGVAAAPGVVATAIRLAGDGVDGLIVDCTDDPGVDIAAASVEIPVVGPGAALRDAAAAAPGPVRWWSGDELRSIGAQGARAHDLATAVGGARTVVLGGTGWSHLTGRLRRIDPSLVVLDPLDVALSACIDAVRRSERTPGREG